jgi:hypothetical protein
MAKRLPRYPNDNKEKIQEIYHIINTGLESEEIKHSALLNIYNKLGSVGFAWFIHCLLMVRNETYVFEPPPFDIKDISQKQPLSDKPNKLLEILDKYGINKFIIQIFDVLKINHESILNPLKEKGGSRKLHTLENQGYCVSGLNVERIGDPDKVLEKESEYKLRIEIPLNGNIKEYQKAIEVFQNQLLSQSREMTIVEFLAFEYKRGVSYKELAEIVNESLEKWADGEATDLDIYDLDAFFKRKRRTREEFERFTEEDVRRLVKYNVTKK